jgi:shikimate dehydrogenase
VNEFLRGEVGDMLRTNDPRQKAHTLDIVGVGTVAHAMIAGAPFEALLAASGVRFRSGSPVHTPQELLSSESWDIALCFSPWKEQLFTLIDQSTASARATMAVDTVIRAGGSALGLNINGWAAGYALETALRGSTPETVVVLGSGPSARSVAWGVRRVWGDDVDLVVSARNEKEGLRCAGLFAGNYAPPADLSSHLGNRVSRVVVNGTTWGETSESESTPFSFDVSTIVAPGSAFVDLNTRLSALQSIALAIGATVTSGMTMRLFNNACRAALASVVAHGPGATTSVDPTIERNPES